MMLLEPANSPEIRPIDKLAEGRNYWVDRFGNAYVVQMFEHSNWAWHHMECQTDELEEAGWIHISGGDCYCFQSRLTNSQQRTLLAFCEAHNLRMTSIMHDLYSWRGTYA